MPERAATPHRQLRFHVRPERLAVCRLAPDTLPPAWALQGSFYSITRTPDELSIVCAESAVPDGTRCEKDWACLQLAGPFDFGLTGILEAFLRPLAEASVPIFALSTFDTDWVLIPAVREADALRALATAGHHVE